MYVNKRIKVKFSSYTFFVLHAISDGSKKKKEILHCCNGSDLLCGWNLEKKMSLETILSVQWHTVKKQKKNFSLNLFLLQIFIVFGLTKHEFRSNQKTGKPYIEHVGNLIVMG